MLSAKDALFKGADCYNDSLSHVPVDQNSLFPDIQTHMIYNVAANTQTDYNQNSSSTDPLIDLFEGQSYVSLIESSGLPFYRSQESSGGKRLDNFPVNPWLLNEETVSSETFMNTDQAESLQAVNVNYAHGFQSNMKGEIGASHLASTSTKSTPTESKCLKRVPKKRSVAESCRRSIVSQKVQVLYDDLPETSKGKQANQISILNDFIDHIMYLQLQLKELSKSRLGSKPNSVPLMFVEGYGYYHPDAEKLGEPLDEFVRSLFEDDPDTLHKVLESYGLYKVPMASFL